MITFADLVEHCLAYAGKDATRAANADYRRAVLNAYRAMPTRHEWLYYWTLGRVLTNASQTDGTIAFDLTGGLNERQVTLSGATWPSWAASGYLMIGDVPYEVDERVSDTVLTLESDSAPDADLDAGTSYTLLRDTYLLPSDFVQGDETVSDTTGAVLEYVHARDWASSRRTNQGPGRPVFFTYTGHPDALSRLAIRLWPPPDAAYPLDMVYRRRPRAMVYDQVTDGLVSVAASGTTVTGTNTRFTAAHVGSVIRLAADALELPTGLDGAQPYAQERTITEYTSATSVTVDSAFDDTYSGVKYVLSDPADVEPDAMAEFLLREVEHQFRLVARLKPNEAEQPEYQLAFARAREADARYSGRRASLRRQARRSGLADMPIRFD